MFGCTTLPPGEKPAILLSRLHGERKRGQRSGSLVDLDAVQIVGQDQSRDVGRLIALLFVNRVQQIKRIRQHVTAAAGRIADFDFFGTANPQEVALFRA